MGKAIFLMLFVSLFISCKKNEIDIPFESINSNTNLLLNKIEFLDSLHGFIVGGDRFQEACLLLTEDGGEHWTRKDLSFAPEKKALYGIATNTNGKVVLVGFGGTIFTSSDSGKTFEYHQHNSWRELQDVAIRNNDSCIIVGGIGFDEGFFSSIKNDGNGDKNIQEEWKAEMCDVDMLNENLGFISGFGGILKTIDGGKEWNFTDAKNDYFKAMTWQNEQVGIAVGYQGSICKTSNTGDSWKTIRNGNKLAQHRIHFLDIAFHAPSTYVAVGEKGCICLSQNNGEDWKTIHSFTTKDLRGVTFSENGKCFVVGEEGQIFLLKF